MRSGLLLMGSAKGLARDEPDASTAQLHCAGQVLQYAAVRRVIRTVEAPVKHGSRHAFGGDRVDANCGSLGIDAPAVHRYKLKQKADLKPRPRSLVVNLGGCGCRQKKW